jgi:hypothetical protein
MIISIVINLLLALGFLGYSILVPFVDQAKIVEDKTVATVLFVFLFLFFLAAALVKFWAAHLMRLGITAKKGGVIAFVAGLLSIDILSVIGGFLAIIDATRSEQYFPTPPQPVIQSRFNSSLGVISSNSQQIR